MPGSKLKGVLVFTYGGRVWICGKHSANSVGVLIALNDDFSVASSRYYSNTIIIVGGHDGTGHAYFLNVKKAQIVKVRESDYAVIF